MKLEPLSHPPSQTAREIYSVARLNQTAKVLLEQALPLIWVEGEISNLARPASGHLYFTLKDSAAQVRCALFRGQQQHAKAIPRDGMHVLLRARVTLYEGRGEFQLVVNYLEEAGEGALRRAYDLLKQRLAEAGLFDAARKRALPKLPRRIGVVTSPTGAAIRDIVTTLQRRFPAIPVRVYPVRVQGDGAAAEIAAALRLASARRDCDVLILARGGGSLEDLWAFNEEVVARAVQECEIPVVCGVGHEIDTTIADLVADQRAATPTAAAELVSPDQYEWRAKLESQAARLTRLARDRITASSQRLDWAAHRLLHPAQRLGAHRQRIDDLHKRMRLAHRAQTQQYRLHLRDLSARAQAHAPQSRFATLGIRCRVGHEGLIRALRTRLQYARQRQTGLSERLHGVSPLATVARGYAIARRCSDNAVIRSASQVDAGDRIKTTLQEGKLVCIVEKAQRA